MNEDRYRNNRNFKQALKGGENESPDEHEPIQAQPLEVKVYGNFEKALKAFRALVQKERILSSYKEKQTYEKPSDKNRRKRNERKRKMMELENSSEHKSSKHNKSKE